MHHTIDPEIFRAYDIRGIVGTQLSEDSLYQIGQAIGSTALAAQEYTIITARDGRLSSPMLVVALQQGILSTGCHVIDIGLVPTPLLYFATHVLKSQSGIMVTGSHNPAEYNGLKITLAGKAMTAEALQTLYTRIVQLAFVTGQGKLTQQDMVPAYLDAITDHIQLARPLKLVIDCGNGVSGPVALELFTRLGCQTTGLYTEIDGRFPHHHPDPSVPANLADLIDTVTRQKADIGLAFDGDGDRLGVVSNAGEIIWADRQLALFAQDILQRQPGGTIIYDVKCSRHLGAIIRQHGGKPLMYKTGHSLIKTKMQETHAILSGEMSGHLYFQEHWFGFDDGMYAGARLLEILAKQSLSCADLFHTIPNSINTPELKLPILEQHKSLFMTQLIAQAHFPDAQIHTIDGLRVDFADGFGLIRPSNTTPHLVLRFEADDTQGLLRIQAQFRTLLLNIDPTLVLPF